MNQDIRNLVITIFLSTLILLGWQYFYDNPRQAAIQKNIELKQQAKDAISAKNEIVSEVEPSDSLSGKTEANIPHIKINSETLTGSISLQGLRFDDLSLNHYKKTTDLDSENVKLFHKSGKRDSYFVEFGWLSANKDLEVPTKFTLWQADKMDLNAGGYVTFTWKNSKNVIFKVTIGLDENYMFSIKQDVINGSNHEINLQPYGLVYRTSKHSDKPIMVFHEGAIGVFDNILKEVTYEDLVSKEKQKFSSKAGGWIGFTDKYWLASIIPTNSVNFDANFIGSKIDGVEKLQVDYIGPTIAISSDETYSLTSNLFAGAKVAKLLNNYSEQYKIALFDRAIDYGWFYFITKPMFLVLNYIFLFTKNFGIAIILITILIKILMFPIANKSFKTMQRMKKLQPTIAKLKEQYAGDSMKLNSEMMALYKRESLSPLSGCLPLIVQMPVFFSLYKVIFISIEMRHAPFFGWIKDLSSPDPTTIFNLFGIIPWTPPQVLMIGIWPLIMGLTMFLQQKMNPEPADPVQAKVMKFLPFIFVFMFQSFPAGLMIYWSWSNILSMMQQFLINKRHEN